MANQTYLSTKTTVKGSPIHGKGLFAAARIKRGELVAIKGGEIFTKDYYLKHKKDIEPSEFYITDNLLIGSTDKALIPQNMMYTNHSCEPNIGMQGQIVLVAMRDIEPGEELTHDWAMTDIDNYKIKCHCNTKSCRGYIKGNDWQSKILQRKYKGYFSWYVQSKIDQS